MGYDPKIHHRRSIRLKKFDYSQSGFYFITICTQNHLCLLGKIENSRMETNDAGDMIRIWWKELGNKYPIINLHESVIMPNHFHGIIEIQSDLSVGANLCVRPGESKQKSKSVEGQTHRSAPTGVPINKMVQWFKTMTTNEYIRGVKNNNWPQFDKKLWQRNYFEHIIRNEKSYVEISEYIQTNPLKWHLDRYYEQ